MKALHKDKLVTVKQIGLKNSVIITKKGEKITVPSKEIIHIDPEPYNGIGIILSISLVVIGIAGLIGIVLFVLRVSM